jgi:hypothetical protein
MKAIFMKQWFVRAMTASQKPHCRTMNAQKHQLSKNFAKLLLLLSLSRRQRNQSSLRVIGAAAQYSNQNHDLQSLFAQISVSYEQYSPIEVRPHDPIGYRISELECNVLHTNIVP